jgi:hypothetical protein
VQDPRVFGQGIDEDIDEVDDEKDDQCNREIGDQAICCVANIAFAFPDQPARAKQGIPDTKADVAQRRKRPPEDHPDGNEPGLLAVPERRNRAQHGTPSRLVTRRAEQNTNPEIEPVKQHVL